MSRGLACSEFRLGPEYVGDHRPRQLDIATLRFEVASRDITRFAR
jgi:hypothetical protein